jgi:hypothetical protein
MTALIIASESIHSIQAPAGVSKHATVPLFDACWQGNCLDSDNDASLHSNETMFLSAKVISMQYNDVVRLQRFADHRGTPTVETYRRHRRKPNDIRLWKRKGEASERWRIAGSSSHCVLDRQDVVHLRKQRLRVVHPKVDDAGSRFVVFGAGV